VSRLQLAGYCGYCDVELMGEEIESSDYRELLKHSKVTFDDWCRNQCCG
jgi:hypothetical protein